MLVPALTTKYLQPLDTHVFAVYKLRLQRVYHEVGVAKPVNFSTLLECVCTAIEETIMSRDWPAAFSSNGFSSNQGGLSVGKLSKLSISGGVCVPTSRPSTDQLKACFPKTANVVAAAVWRCVDTPRMPLVGDSAVPKSMPLRTFPVLRAKAKPICTRTRAETKSAFLVGPASSKD